MKKDGQIKLGVFGHLLRGHKVLLGKRLESDSSFAGKWCHPGGGVEFREDLHSALRREFKEEVGLDVAVSDGYCAIHQYFGEDRHVVLVFKEVVCAGNPIAGDGFEKVDWFSADEIRELAFRGETTPLTLTAAEGFFMRNPITTSML